MPTAALPPDGLFQDSFEEILLAISTALQARHLVMLLAQVPRVNNRFDVEPELVILEQILEAQVQSLRTLWRQASHNPRYSSMSGVDRFALMHTHTSIFPLGEADKEKLRNESK